MNIQNHLRALLLKAGLRKDEAALYLFIRENPGLNVFEAAKKCGISKSSAYRAFEALKESDLVQSDNSLSWKSEFKAKTLDSIIRKLQNKNRHEKRLISELKILNSTQKLNETTGGGVKSPLIETFKKENVLEKYLEISSLPWQTNLVFGNWEDFNEPHQGIFDFVKLEKTFIKNRMKNGGNAHIFITKDGPYTHEITDYDADENRTTKVVSTFYEKPLWINAFEGNDLVYIWNMDEKNRIYSTLIDSKAVADFYKNFIYSHMF